MGNMNSLAWHFSSLDTSVGSSPPPTLNSVMSDNVKFKVRVKWYQRWYDLLSRSPDVYVAIQNALGSFMPQLESLENTKAEIMHDLQALKSSGTNIDALKPRLKKYLDGVTVAGGAGRAVLDNLEDLQEGGVIDAHQYKTFAGAVKSELRESIHAAQAVVEQCQSSGVDIDEVTGGTFHGGGDFPILGKYLEKVDTDPADSLLDVELESDPKATLELLEITMNDRYIFIALTFVLRMVTLFLIQWAVNSEMILNFQQTFIQYTMIYCMLIIFLTFVISTNDLGMQQLLYYMDVNTHGYSRLMLHLFLVVVLIPILYVIKLPNTTNAQTNVTFEYKQQLISSISIFSWVIWLFTSLAALRF